jgi:drug/metabolite transporter (DMT)-like permease
MRLAALTALVMTAFAANSILNRMAVGPGLIGATDFALVRALAGAAMLGLLVLARHRALPLSSRRRIPGALGLALYLVGFSTAYIAIDAGIGALILFGGVQLTMFAGALLAGEAMAAATLDRGRRSPWRGLPGLSGRWAMWRCHGFRQCWRCWPRRLAGASIR